MLRDGGGVLAEGAQSSIGAVALRLLLHVTARLESATVTLPTDYEPFGPTVSIEVRRQRV